MAHHSLISILIVEDDPVIADDISLILEKKGYSIAGIGYDATKAIDLLANRDFDLAILDISVGTGKTGIDVAKIIKDKYHKPFIFLTSYSDENTLSAAKEEMPFGYLVKPFQEATLLSTVSLALTNFQTLLKMEKSAEKQVDLNKFDVNLTETEQKICLLLCKGFSYKEVSEKAFISINTTRYHVKNLYSKFGVSSRSELVALIIQ